MGGNTGNGRGNGNAGIGDSSNWLAQALRDIDRALSQSATPQTPAAFVTGAVANSGTGGVSDIPQGVSSNETLVDQCICICSAN